MAGRLTELRRFSSSSVYVWRSRCHFGWRSNAERGKKMKKTLLAMTLLCGSAFAQYPDSAYPPEGGYGPSSAYPALAQDPYSMGGASAPACGPGTVWIDGYNDPNGYFVNGYCTAPPFIGAYWVAPRFFGGRFVAGYWGRGGYGANYGVRGEYREGSHAGGGYASGFRAPAASAPSFRSQGNYRGGYRGGGTATRGGGSGHGGRR